MTALPKHKMTVDEFMAWSAMTPGRFELFHGVVYEMSAERTGHAKVKYRIQNALESGIARAGLPCHMLPDGMTVRVAKDGAHEPDALVYCGVELPDDSMEVAKPAIVVEVSSPSTPRVDAGVKVAGYFSLPSLRHYLIVDPERLPIILHSRRADGTILTRLVSAGSIRLDPPGIDVAVDGLI